MLIMKATLSVLLAGLSLTSWAQPPADYYAGTNNLVGSDLKSALHSIIDGHTVLKYTESGNDEWFDGQNVDVWEALIYTDSACPDTDPDCGFVQLLYLDEVRHADKANRGSGQNDMWEREHVWPKSRGFPSESQDGFTDLHHLRPADRNINGKHSNFGYDTGGDVVNDKLADGTEVPTSARLDSANESFEPTDRAKGQVEG
jgi:endonuclease I